ncbi:MAG: hypothetical protein FWD39_01855 [Clostridiales bacterium]|nr:hypothetical protein [Clostridiales bacterium]
MNSLIGTANEKLTRAGQENSLAALAQAAESFLHYFGSCAVGGEKGACAYFVKDPDLLCREIGRSAFDFGEKQMAEWRLDVSIAASFAYWERQCGTPLGEKERSFVSRLPAAWETVLLLSSLWEKERDGAFESLWKELYQAFAGWLAFLVREDPRAEHAEAAEDENSPASVGLDEDL